MPRETLALAAARAPDMDRSLGSRISYARRCTEGWTYTLLLSRSHPVSDGRNLGSAELGRA